MSGGNDPKVYITGYYDIPKDQIATIRPAMLENIALSRAEPGNLRYDFRDDETIEGRVHLTEVYVHQAAFDAHLARVKASPWAEISKDVIRTFQVRTGE